MYGICCECMFSHSVEHCKCLTCQCSESDWFECFVTKKKHEL